MQCTHMRGEVSEGGTPLWLGEFRGLPKGKLWFEGPAKCAISVLFEQSGRWRTATSLLTWIYFLELKHWMKKYHKPPFQRRKVNEPRLSIKTPPPPSPPLHLYSSQKINLDWSVMVYSGWIFILFLVFGCTTSNFMCWTFSTLCSSSLWRIVTS